MPYPNKQITNLRKEGKLDEVLQFGKEALQNDPENIWIKRALAWVYYDLGKQNIENTPKFISNIEHIIEMNFDENETMLFDNIGFLIGKKVFHITKQKDFPLQEIEKLFELIKKMHFTKPGDSYSFIFKAFRKAFKNSSLYLEFADWWNFDNFQEKNYEPEVINGKKIMSIVEQAYVAYAKNLINSLNKEDVFEENDHELQEETAETFIKKLDEIIIKRPDYKYPVYFKAKILLALNKKEEALNDIRPFLLRNQKVYWVWSLVAEIIDNPKLKLACYSKALSMKNPEKLIRNIRKETAKLLIKFGKYTEAKTEVLKYIKTSVENNFKVDYEIQNIASKDWYNNTVAKQDNNNLYHKYIPLTKQILYGDLPKENIVISFVNKERHLASFVVSKNKEGFFNYSSLGITPEVGDIFRVQMKLKGDNSFYDVFTAEKMPDDTQISAINIFNGHIRLNLKGFGFVDDIFVPPYLVENKNLEDNERVTGKAILSYNKHKKSWGWKCFEIMKDDAPF